MWQSNYKGPRRPIDLTARLLYDIWCYMFKIESPIIPPETFQRHATLARGLLGYSLHLGSRWKELEQILGLRLCRSSNLQKISGTCIIMKLRATTEVGSRETRGKAGGANLQSLKIADEAIDWMQKRCFWGVLVFLVISPPPPSAHELLTTLQSYLQGTIVMANRKVDGFWT